MDIPRVRDDDALAERSGYGIRRGGGAPREDGGPAGEARQRKCAGQARNPRPERVVGRVK